MVLLYLRCQNAFTGKAKRREEYLQNQDDELESSRIRYDADAEQRLASARDMYRANLRYKMDM